jgi:hypothetical protein
MTDTPNDIETPRPRMPLVPGPSGTRATAGLTQHTPGANIAVADSRSAGALVGSGTIQPVPETKPPAVIWHGPTGKIAKAIANVSRAVGTIKKRGRNEFFNYDYATFDDLLYAITPLMGEQGLAVTQTEIEIKQVDRSHVAVKYEFVVYHESGERLPPQIHTGMSLLLTRKGTYDDKAINKCHSAARKYFLSSLYQVPAGDFDDSDADEDEKGRAQQPVPGPPADQAKKPGPARGTVPAQTKPAPQEATPSAPQRLTLPQGTTGDMWAAAYIRAIGAARSEDEIKQWDKLHDDVLQRISEKYPLIYETIAAAVERRLMDVGRPSRAMPDPKKDPQDSMNWIASQLQGMSTYEAAEAFWNQVVAPREKEFEQLDWEMLMAEWKRTEDKLTAEATPPQDAA